MQRTLKDRPAHHSASSQRVAQSLRPSARGGIASLVDSSPLMAAQRKKLQSLFGGTAQRQEETSPKPDNTGLPDHLKSRIESLSGLSMDHVKVHYNSSLPAQLNALAYARGSDIHVAPGQEKHLPHDAWHVVQQAQGRVKPTMQMAGGVAVNDDKGLEREADAMGARAVQMKTATVARQASSGQEVVQLAAITKDKLNVAGEDHDESKVRRADEGKFAFNKAGGDYWEEHEFKVNFTDSSRSVSGLVEADSLLLRWLNLAHLVLHTPISGFSEDARELQKQSIRLVTKGIRDLLVMHQILDGKSNDDKALLNSRHRNDTVTVENILGQTAFIKTIEGVADSLDAKLENENFDVQEEATTLEAETFSFETGLYDLPHTLKEDDFKATALKRSLLMAESAQQEKADLGIWKIGNNHVTDIKEKYEGPQEFNLLDREEFNALFNAWQQPVERRQFWWRFDDTQWWDGLQWVEASERMPWVERDGGYWTPDGKFRWDDTSAQWLENKKRKKHDDINESPTKKLKTI